MKMSSPLSGPTTRHNSPWVRRSQTATRIAFGSFMFFAGISHMTFAREEFQAQVSSWIPVDDDLVVLVTYKEEVVAGCDY